MVMSTKRKAPGKLAQPTLRTGAKVPSKSVINESRTSVVDAENPTTSQLETIEISSDAGSDEDLSDDDEEDEEEQPLVNGDGKAFSHLNGSHQHQQPAHVKRGNADEEDEQSDGEPTSPSFGELLRDQDAVDVPSLLQQTSASGTSLSQPNRAVIAPPNHQSLTTVLTQALRTDDTDLLESCLHTTHLPTIKNTIENIDSTLAGALLTKLASRLHRRPGRAGTLMTWVQWTLVSHGGALASQPKVIQSLSSLQKVLSERSKGLGSLLALKGKLDLLDSQMAMRKRMQRHSGAVTQGEGADDDEDVIWVEGEDDDAGAQSLSNGVASRRKRIAAEDDDDDDDDEAPVMNGVMGDSSDEEDEVEAEDDDSEGAEESLDEDEVDHDDVDESMGEDEDSDVETAPPSKLQKVAKSFSKRK